jgi:hypothetical protein
MPYEECLQVVGVSLASTFFAEGISWLLVYSTDEFAQLRARYARCKGDSMFPSWFLLWPAEFRGGGRTLTIPRSLLANYALSLSAGSNAAIGNWDGDETCAVHLSKRAVKKK